VFISKKIFSRTSWPISIKLGTNHLWVKGIQNCTNKGPGPLQREDLKISRTTESEELIFTWTLGVGMDHYRENHIYMCN
jgi:hypothetical protein